LVYDSISGLYLEAFFINRKIIRKIKLAGIAIIKQNK